MIPIAGQILLWLFGLVSLTLCVAYVIDKYVFKNFESTQYMTITRIKPKAKIKR